MCSTFALTIVSGLFMAASPGERPFPSTSFVPIAQLRDAPWAAELERRVDSIAKRYPGDLGVYVSDPYRGFKYGFNAGRPMYLASGVKIAFMVEVFRQRENGRLKLEDTLTYSQDDIRDGGPRTNKTSFGTELSIATLLDWMMRSSDNAASDMLAKHVGLANVNAGLDADGLAAFTPLTLLIDVRRGVFREVDLRADDFTPLEIRTVRWTSIWDPQVRKLTEVAGRPRGTYGRQELMEAYDRYYATGVNAAPMASVGMLFEKMVRGELISESASREMLELMSGARTSTHRILGRLPSGTRVAHKTGSQFKRLCDLGVVYLPDGLPMILTMCTAEGSVHASESAVAEITRAAFDLVVADHRAAEAEAKAP